MTERVNNPTTLEDDDTFNYWPRRIGAGVLVVAALGGGYVAVQEVLKDRGVTSKFNCSTDEGTSYVTAEGDSVWKIADPLAEELSISNPDAIELLREANPSITNLGNIGARQQVIIPRCEAK